MMQFNTVKELPATTLWAAKKQVWCLAIKHDMTPLGGLFEVEYDDNDSVAMLKEKIKTKKSNDCKNVDTDHLTVWQCKEPDFILMAIYFNEDSFSCYLIY